MLKISIITPNFNSGKYLQDTIDSVKALKLYNFIIEYIVVDGLSTDNSADVINKNRDFIDKIIIEKDNSMYEALVKGIKSSTGDYLCYINSGDLLFPTALTSVIEYLESNVEIITCRKLLMNDRFQIYSDILPCRYFIDNILLGYNSGFLEYLQQESTIFKNGVLDSEELSELSKLKYAGDYFIWRSFSKRNFRPLIVDTLFGLFRKHDGQLSENNRQYKCEVMQMSDDFRTSALPYLLISIINICIYRGFVKVFKFINSIKSIKP